MACVGVVLKEVYFQKRASGHPGIAEYIEFLEDDDRIYLVSEQIVGIEDEEIVSGMESEESDDSAVPYGSPATGAPLLLAESVGSVCSTLMTIPLDLPSIVRQRPLESGCNNLYKCQDLFEWVKQSCLPLHPKTIFKIFTQVVSAVSHMYSCTCN